jgi:hypothetical protein
MLVWVTPPGLITWCDLMWLLTIQAISMLFDCKCMKTGDRHFR